MLALSYASVPIYSLFCKVTGYGGTVKRVQVDPNATLGSKKIKVRFNADVSPGLPMRFQINQKPILVATGEPSLVFYKAINTSDEPIEVMAIYNVAPHKAGKYFNKVSCFCFSRQTLMPNVEVVMPVSFFIDKEIENDSDAEDVGTITLSYTFFPYSK